MSAAQPTIFAPATGAARAAVTVLRVSGPLARAILGRLIDIIPAPREAALRAVRSSDGAVIDRGLVLWFPGPGSFTGEDLFELQLHGGPAIIAATSEALLAAGAVPAEPGAFTRRAFENGKLDLTQAEAIADLVDAETDAQRRQALRQLDGGVSEIYDALRAQLTDALAWIEAAVDFPDEGDVPGAVALEARSPLAAAQAELARQLAAAERGERIREGFTVAIIGAPNVGKSTLLNRLARREAAIVADVPGTTRDVIEVRRILAGHVVVFADTAGLRGTDDAVEREGVARARQAAADADLRIGVVDLARNAETAAALDGLSDGDLIWLNKRDLAPQTAMAPLTQFHVEQLGGSALEGSGVEALEAAVAARVAHKLSADEGPTLTRARHRQAVAAALQALARAEGRLASDPELAAEDVRAAAAALARLTGRIDVEDVLDRIFGDFCIGK